MNNLISIVIKSGISLALFYSFYHLLLRKEKFFLLNRVFLLFSLFFSTLYPLIHIKMPTTLEPVINQFNFTEEIPLLDTTTWNQSIIDESMHWSFTRIVLMIYIAGVIVFFIRYIIRLAGIWKLSFSKKAEQTTKGKIKFIKINAKAAPFSFFNRIFIPSEGITPEELDKIIPHEKIHAAHWHSLDVLLVEFFLVVQWFNPFAYRLRKAVIELHEYTADASVIASGVDHLTYQSILLNQVREATIYCMASGFNYSLTKKRMAMISKIKSKKRAYIKFLFALPLVLVLLAATSSKYNEVILVKDDISSTVQNSGNIPSILPVEGDNVKLTQKYGRTDTTINNKEIHKFHYGVDLSAPLGTSVVATADGIVRKMEGTIESNGYGIYIIIDHTYGYSTLYAHLLKYNVEEGQQVKCGDIIGQVGQSGKATGPHLHYEVKKDGERVNPEDYFPKIPE
ncbi:MAG: peptidoglycan DD-metalloendopeptidase family protein [Bacteroidales bacterium]|nr:peptidoglycan DD-metalloendopeptidase family protein [Bacteroidales bacterium]